MAVTIAGASTGVNAFALVALAGEASNPAATMLINIASGKALWVDYSFYPVAFVSLQNTDRNASLESVKLAQLQGAFAVAYRQAVQAIIPISGTLYSARAAIVADAHLTLPTSPALGDTLELRYRVTDAANYWTAYVTYTGSQWDFKLDSVVAGTPTNRITVTNVGNVATLRVIVDGDDHTTYTSGGAWTQRGTTVTNSTHNTAVQVSAVWSAGAVARLTVVARTGWDAMLREAGVLP